VTGVAAAGLIAVVAPSVADNQATDSNINIESVQQNNQDNGQEGQRNERRSRDRYGRDRRERNGDRPERTDRSNEIPANASAETSAEASGTAFIATATSSSSAASSVTAPASTVATAAAAAHPAASALPIATIMPAVSAYALPVTELSQVATTSGLQWVGSDAAKIAAAQAAIAAEQAKAPAHVPRERPPAVVVESANLVLVETKRDLRDMTLPFEKSGA
jgi:ribonuclease E